MTEHFRPRGLNRPAPPDRLDWPASIRFMALACGMIWLLIGAAIWSTFQ